MAVSEKIKILTTPEVLKVLTVTSILGIPKEHLGVGHVEPIMLICEPQENAGYMSLYMGLGTSA
jgi:hypothetical protein